MIEIIEPGTKNRIRCDYCGALLSYSKEDIKEKLEYIGNRFCENLRKIIVCPQCQNEIILEEKRGLQTNKTSE